MAPFVRLDRAANRLTRLDAGNVARVAVANDLGRRAGVARGTNPYGLRHQGITRALDLAGGDVRKVRRFSRQSSSRRCSATMTTTATRPERSPIS